MAASAGDGCTKCSSHHALLPATSNYMCSTTPFSVPATYQVCRKAVLTCATGRLAAFNDSIMCNILVSQEHLQQKPVIQARRKPVGSCRQKSCQCLSEVRGELLPRSQMWACSLHETKASWQPSRSASSMHTAQKPHSTCAALNACTTRAKSDFTGWYHLECLLVPSHATLWLQQHIRAGKTLLD